MLIAVFITEMVILHKYVYLLLLLLLTPQVPQTMTLKQGSESLVTSKTTALVVNPESALGPEGHLMILTRVETKLHYWPIMATNTSKQWATSWFDE